LSDDTQLVGTFSVEPLVIYNCALYNVKVSPRVRDIRDLDTRVGGQSRPSYIIPIDPAPKISC